MILTIDPGSRLGWSLWGTDGELLKYGAYESKSKLGTVPKLISVVGALQDLFDEHKPTLLVLEDVTKGHYKTWQARVWAIYTCITAQLEAYNRGLYVELVAPGTLKKAITGSGKAGKPEMIAAANNILELSLGTKNDDEADALLLGVYFFRKCTEEAA